MVADTSMKFAAKESFEFFAIRKARMVNYYVQNMRGNTGHMRSFSNTKINR